MIFLSFEFSILKIYFTSITLSIMKLSKIVQNNLDILKKETPRKLQRKDGSKLANCITCMVKVKKGSS